MHHHRYAHAVTEAPRSQDLRGHVLASPTGKVAVRLCSAVDAERVISPAVAVFDRSGPVAVDAPEAIGQIEGTMIDLGDCIGLPPLVNAHAHLDLTRVGSLPFDGTFANWAGEVRRLRPQTRQAIAAAVHEGVRRSVAGGTGFIGDIAGSFGVAALEALRSSAAVEGLRGVSYVEVFGIGNASTRGLEFLSGLRDRVPADRDGIRLGVSPHATYSCDDAVYAAAAALGLPLATHVAETLDEVRFVQDGSGPFSDLLKAVGAWTPALQGWGTDPLQRVQRLLRGRAAALVHLNYLDDSALRVLAEEAASDRSCVPVYCPRASQYFRHPSPGHAPHRYRELLAAGVPVALGTDSAIVLGDAATISVLDEMRLLWRRDAADARLLLAMATVHGARALHMDPSLVRLPGVRGGRAASMLVVRGRSSDWKESLLAGDRPCEWLWRAA